MIFLSEVEVRELLDLDALVDALASAHAELSAGKVSMPPRIAALVAEQEGLLGVMPSYLPSAGLACKLVTLFPHNRDRHTHQALICVFDPENGTPLAVMDGTHITAARTAAGSALATRLLALAVLQLGLALWLYGRLPGTGAAGLRTGNVHRAVGIVALLVTLPIAYHCAFAYGVKTDIDTRVAVHSLAGCFVYGRWNVLSVGDAGMPSRRRLS